METISYQKVGIVVEKCNGETTWGYLLEEKPNISIGKFGNLSVQIDKNKIHFCLEGNKLIVKNQEDVEDMKRVKEELRYIYGSDIEMYLDGEKIE